MKKAISLILTVTFLMLSIANIAFATEIEKTTTSYRYENKFLTAKLFYSDFAMISDTACPIPGLENTVVAGENCSTMTPQGLCVTEDYIFISAYCNAKKYIAELKENADYGKNSDKLEVEENHSTHNSVIYIIDRESGEYIKNMVLPDTNHVGGLATDGENIFIAKSTDAQISVISLKTVQKVVETKSMSVEVDYEYIVDCGCTASFVTYYNDLLWVGVFNENDKGKLNAFSVDAKSFELSEVTFVEIPAKANGASFTEINGEICLNVNSSYGRKNISHIYLYSVSNYGTKQMAITLKDTYNAPPTVQNSCIYDSKVYFIYESAATCYSEVDSAFDTKATTCAVDRVCIGDESILFNWHANDNIFLLKISNIVSAIVKLYEVIFS